MVDAFRGFYERYWADDGLLLPEGDPSTKERKRLLTQSLTLEGRGKRVLDAGCGKGEFSEYMANLGFDVVGLDIAEKAVATINKKEKDRRYLVASLQETLPFQDETFDVIWCSEVIEHVLDVHSCLSELNRVLKKKGALIITTPYHGILKSLVIVSFSFDTYFSPYTSHIRFFSKKTLCVATKNAGFRLDSVRYLCRFYPFNRLIYLVARKSGEPLKAPTICG